MSRLLIVSHPYSPLVSARTLRWGAIAEEWAAQGNEVHVLTCRFPGTRSEETLKGVHVHRVGGGMIERLRRRLSGSASRTKTTAATNASSKGRHGPSGWIHRSVRLLHDCLWRNVYWPDHACLWISPAVRKALELHRREPFDAVITSSLPFTDHCVGLRLKRRFPQLPWVADIGDPFCFLKETPTNNHRLYDRLNFRTEKAVVTTAEALSVTNEATAMKYAMLFPGCEDRMKVIHPLLRSNAEPASAWRLFPEDDRIRLVYVGTLYPAVRSPAFGLEVFSKLLRTSLGNRLELHFFGAVNGCDKLFARYEALLEKHLFLHGEVPHAVARQAMAEAACLVNIGNTTTYQLPSKLVEYSGTGKPILNFATAAEDSSALFLKPYPASLTVTREEWESDGGRSAGAARVVQFLERKTEITGAELQHWCRPFRPETIARKYTELIEAARRRTAGILTEGIAANEQPARPAA